jgi:hypothetical protein
VPGVSPDADRDQVAAALAPLAGEAVISEGMATPEETMMLTTRPGFSDH